MYAPSPTTYLNPVYPRSCPDPFVLKHQGEYWCYCTGIWTDGLCFGILHSPDLVHWQEVSGAMLPLPGGATCYWAPEVSYLNSRFYLYYSVGDGTQMHIRVAVADRPQGPFLDSEHRLTTEEFAIDAHVFEDEDGARYLFYATDFLNHTHIGTGTVVDRMLDPFRLAGQPRPVTRACYDWQVYDPQREEKGGVRWHTVEGPFVLKHKGRYYEMFSGGNWQNPGYGVSYATSPEIHPVGEWLQACDGQQVLPVLRSFPERGVIGPGHNSVVRSPDNRQLFCAYHRWMDTAGEGEPVRVLAVDRLEWVGERLAVLGPTTTPQPVPRPATIRYFTPGDPEQAEGLGPGWSCKGGRWSSQAGAAQQEASRPGELSEARLVLPAASFLLEVSLQALEPMARTPGAYGLLLDGERGEAFNLALLPRTGGEGTATGLVSTGLVERPLALPGDFQSVAVHRLRLEVNGRLVKLALDGIERWQGWLEERPARLVLFTRGLAAAFSAMELTLGWEDLFAHPEPQPIDALAALGWQAAGDENWQIVDQELRYTGLAVPFAAITKEILPGSSPGNAVSGSVDYDLIVNARLDQVSGIGGYGFYPALDEQGEGPLLLIERLDQGWVMQEDRVGTGQVFSLPEGFDPRQYQQFRFNKQGERMQLQWEAHELGEIRVAEKIHRVGLSAHSAVVGFEMVRVTVM